MKTKRETVLITGATSGIGNDMANIFAERGYDLFLASRNREKMDAIREKLEKLYGITVNIMSIDLIKSSSARKVYEETVSRNIEISVLVNNAGFGVYGEHVDLDPDKSAEMIQLNASALTQMCSFFGREMKKKKRGYILNVASTAAYQPTPFTAVYGATKSYVLSFSEALAKELEDYGVVVTCLSPGPTDTNFFQAAGVQDILDSRKTGIWAKNNLMESRRVAETGVKALFAKKLSVIAGGWNSLMAFAARLAPRSMTVAVSKKMMKSAAM